MIKYTKEELSLIWLDSFSFLDYRRKLELYKLIRSATEIKRVIENNREYVCASVGEKEYLTLLVSCNGEYLNNVLLELEKRKILAVTLESESYPKLLMQTNFPPLVLYTIGDVKLLNGDCFSIVGSRKSLPLSVNFCKSITKDLVACNQVLVTGIAQGIDVSVVSTALDNNGKVIVVLPSGIDNVYPKPHTQLVEKACEKGLVISEYPPTLTAQKHFYLARNRIIAGLSKGTLIVSSSLKSGTTHTANYALEYGRDLFAVPYSVGIESGAGCNELIKSGAFLVDCSADIINYYSLQSTKTQSVDLTDGEKNIINAIKNEYSTVEKISEYLALPSYQISPILTMLEIKGVIIKNGVNTYAVRREFLEE